VPPCACAVDRTDGQPEAGRLPRRSESRCLVQASEAPDEGPFGIFWREFPGPSFGHGQLTPTRRPPAPTRTPGWLRPDRVGPAGSPAAWPARRRSPATTHARPVSARHRHPAVALSAAATDSHTAAGRWAWRRRCCPVSRAAAAGPRSAGASRTRVGGALGSSTSGPMAGQSVRCRLSPGNSEFKGPGSSAASGVVDKSPALPSSMGNVILTDLASPKLRKRMENRLSGGSWCAARADELPIFTPKLYRGTLNLLAALDSPRASLLPASCPMSIPHKFSARSSPRGRAPLARELFPGTNRRELSGNASVVLPA